MNTLLHSLLPSNPAIGCSFSSFLLYKSGKKFGDEDVISGDRRTRKG
jgi:hypothetical protein